MENIPDPKILDTNKTMVEYKPRCRPWGNSFKSNKYETCPFKSSKCSSSDGNRLEVELFESNSMSLTTAFDNLEYDLLGVVLSMYYSVCFCLSQNYQSLRGINGPKKQKD